MKLGPPVVIGSAACALGLAYFLNSARRTDEGAPTFVVVSMEDDWNRIFPALTPSAADERRAPAPSQTEAQP